mmetsp:Transcript_31261/g.45746  ORF Transcript_31261/g.45746 Transcript_31261/m.45746 type:complete len:115 (-) Transcript_31261:323-667(-)
MLHDSTVLFVSILVTSSSQTHHLCIIPSAGLFQEEIKDLFFVTASHPVSQRYHLLSRCLCFRRENYISRWIRALKLVSLSAFLFTLETLNAYMFYLWSPQKLKGATHKVVTKNI